MKWSLSMSVGAVILISIGIVGALYSLSDRKPNHRYASFTRNLGSAHLTPDRTLELGHAGHYFAGYTDYTIYLGDTHAPGRLIAVDRELRDTTPLLITIDHDSLAYRALEVKVDSPNFYLTDGIMPFIYRGTLDTRKASAWMTDIAFSKAIPFADTSVAFVVIRNLENTIARRDGNTEIRYFPDILEEQGDGIFSTDGMFHYRPSTGTFVYVYYYRNQYIEIDTTFAHPERANTIDTISVAKIAMRTIRSENTLTMGAPPLQVNRTSCVSAQNLYIHSNLLSKNEHVEQFETETVVDVYDLEAKKYRYSFYIPAVSKKKVRDFIVIGDTLLIAKYENKLVSYRIELSGEIDKEIAQ